MELKSPTSKSKRHHIPKSPLFPVFDDKIFCNEYNSFEKFSGYFIGSAVIIDNSDEIKSLYTMGFFGKASLSKNVPNFLKHKKEEPIVLKEYQWERRKDWSNKLCNLIETFKADESKVEDENNMDTSDIDNQSSAKMSVDSNELDGTDEQITRNSEDTLLSVDNESITKELNLSITKTQNLSESLCEENRDVLVINDCKDDCNLENLNPHIEIEPYRTVIETLYLTLEEAFFLSFGLGCLQIMELNRKPLSLLETWLIFNQSQTDFLENYIAYHYFRAKGWIVKSGIKFGGQFLLYRQGPQFYHASYIVLIENIIKSKNEVARNKEGLLTWDKLNSLNRVAETCNKEIIICKIQWPEITVKDKENPSILKKFKVKEFLLRRWHPCKESESND